MLVKAMKMEEDGIQTYNKASLDCAANADTGSKQLFEQLVKDEEGHFDLYDKQRDNMKRFGLSYLALQSYGSGSPESPPTAGD